MRKSTDMNSYIERGIGVSPMYTPESIAETAMPRLAQRCICFATTRKTCRHELAVTTGLLVSQWCTLHPTMNLHPVLRLLRPPRSFHFVPLDTALPDEQMLRDGC